MTYPTIPPQIPACALRSDWTATPIDPLRRTEMDDGNMAVQRRLYRVGGRQTLTWEMSGPQFDLLVAFWLRDLDAGAKWFLCPIVEGSRTQLRLVRFGPDPIWQGVSPAGGIFRFAFTAEVRDLPVLSWSETLATAVWIDRTSDAEIDALIARLAAVETDLGDLVTWT